MATESNETKTETEPSPYTGNDLGEISYSGTSWTVPRFSVPSIYGYTNFGNKQYSKGSEWWFYVGLVTDYDGNRYSVQSTVYRNPKTPVNSFCLGIGSEITKDYYLSAMLDFKYSEPINKSLDKLGDKLNETPSDEPGFYCIKPDDNNYCVGGVGDVNVEIEFKDNIWIPKDVGAGHWNKVFYKLLPDNKGKTGMKGAMYELYHNCSGILSTSTLGIDLYVEDVRGTVLEFMNGISAGFSTQNSSDDIPAGCTYELAQPRLKVCESSDKYPSTLTIDGKVIKVKSGEFWMDRQICNYAATPNKGKGLYVGNWMVLTLDDGISIVLASIWCDKPQTASDPPVWQRGTELGLPPILAEGNVYYPLSDSISKYYQVHNGGKFLHKGDFSINILNTKDPNNSPHWTSPLSKNTYATAWKVDVNLDGNNVRTFYVFALVDKCELGGKFWEGATLIYEDAERTKLIGKGWSEQAGFNPWTKYAGNNLGDIMYSGTSWTVPRVSVPSIYGYTNFGPKETDHGQEWWFYVGTVIDCNDNKYSVFSTITRNCKGKTNTFPLAIGVHNTQDFYMSAAFEIGFNEPIVNRVLDKSNDKLNEAPIDEPGFYCFKPDDNHYCVGGVGSFSAEMENNQIKDIGVGHWNKVFYKLLPDNNGKTGMKGAIYQLYHDCSGIFEKTKSALGIDLYVEDVRGTVLEMMNGVSASYLKYKKEHTINKRPKDDTSDDEKTEDVVPPPCTYEVAQPRLKLCESDKYQSTLTIDGKVIKLKSGELWMDRQICNYAATPTKGKELYCGTWMVLTLDDGNSIVLASIWHETPQKSSDPPVWQSGTELNKPPKMAEGNAYYPLPDLIPKYYELNNGGKFLTQSDFSINILNTKDPNNSPHWTSSLSKNTYSTAWKVNVNLSETDARTFYVFALVDKCELLTMWEGATLIYQDELRTKLVGSGWTEQSGFN